MFYITQWSTVDCDDGAHAVVFSLAVQPCVCRFCQGVEESWRNGERGIRLRNGGRSPRAYRYCMVLMNYCNPHIAFERSKIQTRLFRRTSSSSNPCRPRALSPPPPLCADFHFYARFMKGEGLCFEPRWTVTKHNFILFVVWRDQWRLL
jgi:hypothetical protein